MGSFDFTCAVSNMPLHVGDKIRYVMLTKSPYSDEKGWFVRSFPIKAEYNDYGSIENWDSKDPMIKTLMSGFQIDMVEKGVGDNTVHDRSVKLDMEFSELIERFHQSGLLVVDRYAKQKFDDLKHRARMDAVDAMLEDGKSKPKKDERTEAEIRRDYEVAECKKDLASGRASLRAVERALLNAGYDIALADKYSAKSGKAMHVDVIAHGHCRVRVASYDEGGTHEKVLTTVMAALSPHFSVMLTEGSGRYSYGPELQVMTCFKARTKDHEPLRTIHPLKDESAQFLPCMPAMIHEEVWQSMVNAPAKTYDYNSETGKGKHRKITLEDSKKALQEVINVTRGRASKSTLKRAGFGEGLARDTDLDDPLSEFLQGDIIQRIEGAWALGKDAIPYCTGLATHFRILLKILRTVPTEQIYPTLDQVAEYMFVQDRLFEIRVDLKPSTYFGPQFGEYDKHAYAYGEWAKIAKRRHNRRYR